MIVIEQMRTELSLKNINILLIGVTSSLPKELLQPSSNQEVIVVFVDKPSTPTPPTPAFDMGDFLMKRDEDIRHSKPFWYGVKNKRRSAKEWD